VEKSTTATVLRWLTSVCVLVSAAIHVWLYLDGFDSIAVIGPLFLVNGVAGAVIGVGLLLSRHVVWPLLAVGFCGATALAFVVSATVGLFGVREPFFGPWQTPALLAELLGLVLGAALLLRWWRARP
jgi:hypothetical protein